MYFCLGKLYVKMRCVITKGITQDCNIINILTNVLFPKRDKLQQTKP